MAGARHRPRRAVLGGALLVLLLAGVACTGDLDPTAPTPEPSGAQDPAGDVPVTGPQRGGTLRIGLFTDPVSIDPRFVFDDEGELIVDALFDPLVRVGPDGTLVPAAAESWTVDETGREFTFVLREATFHDGTPVGAADFKRTFDHLADRTAEPPAFLAYLLSDVVGIAASQGEGGPLRGVEVVDEGTLRIRLSAPVPGFLTTLSEPSLVPTPPQAVEDPDAYALEPVGNGPFAMAGPREPGAFIRLVRHEDHTTPPHLDEVLFTLYDAAGEEEAQWADLLDGQLHVAQLVPSRVAEAQERFGRSVDGYAGPGVVDGIRSPVYLYGFDTTQAPFDDARLRRAISLAIDREALAEEVTEGTRAPATALVPPGIPGAQTRACSACVHDPAAAVALLDEVVADLVGAGEPPSDEAGEDETDAAGDPDEAEDEAASEGEGAAEPEEEDTANGAADDLGEDGTSADGEDEEEPLAPEPPPDPAEVIGPITLTYNRGIYHGAIAERMAADIGRTLGLEVGFQGQELGSFVQAVRRGEVPVFRLGWEVGEPTALAYLHPQFHSREVGGDNLTRFAHDELDELLDAARATTDPVERTVLTRRAERIVLDELPAIPVLWYRHGIVIRPEIRDLSYGPLGRMTFADAWFDPATSTP